MIAESDHTLAEIYHYFFAREGFDVEVVRDAWQCRLALRESLPDVLILEYELPWGGALAVLDQLRESPEGKAVSVILNSSGEVPASLLHLSHPPIVGSLLKPFRLRRLAHLVETVGAAPRGPLAFASEHEEAEDQSRREAYASIAKVFNT
jgi:DNA-binding response OmpR family regulator